MRISRWILAFFLVAILSLLALRSRPMTTPRQASVGPAAGYLLEFDPELVSDWHTAAVLEASELSADEIVDVDVDGDTLFLLQGHGWLKVLGNRVADRGGSSARGAPAWVARGVSLSVVRDGIYVLDQARKVVLRFARTGELVGEIRLVAEQGALLDPRSVRAREAGRVHVVYALWRRGEPPRWVVAEYTFGSDARQIRFERTDSRIGAALVGPLLWISPRGSGFLVDPLDYEIIPLGQDESAAARQGAPRYGIADSILKRQSELVRSIPEEWRSANSLPRSWPPVRRFARMDRGEILVVIQAGPEEYTAEAVDSSLTPKASLMASPESHALFPTSTGLFRIRDGIDAIHIDRRTLAP